MHYYVIYEKTWIHTILQKIVEFHFLTDFKSVMITLSEYVFTFAKSLSLWDMDKRRSMKQYTEITNSNYNHVFLNTIHL